MHVALVGPRRWCSVVLMLGRRHGDLNLTCIGLQSVGAVWRRRAAVCLSLSRESSLMGNMFFFMA